MSATSTWRKELSPDELAAYDEAAETGKPLRKVRPNDERDWRLRPVSTLHTLPDDDKPTPQVEPLPTGLAPDSLSTDDLVALLTATTNCAHCERSIDDPLKRRTVFVQRPDGKFQAAAYCSQECLDKLPPSDALTRFDWEPHLKLSPRLRRIMPSVWALWRVGLYGTRIARRLTNQHQKISQVDVSRILTAIENAKKQARHAHYTRQNQSDAAEVE